MKVKQRFSLRKEKIGVVSVLIGLGFFGAAVGAPSVVQAANEEGATVTSEEASTAKVTSEDVKNSKQASDKAAEDVKKQETVVATATNDENSKKQAVNNANKAITNYKNEAGIAEDANVEEELEDAKTEKTEKEEAKNNADKDVATKEEEKSTADSNVKAKEEAKNNADKDVATKEAEKSTADSNVATKEEAKKAADNDVANKNKEITAENAKLEEAKKTLAQKESELTAAKEKVAKLEKEAETNSEQLEDAKKELAQKENEKNAAQSDYDEANKKLEEAKKETAFPYPTEFVTTKEWIDAFRHLLDVKEATKPKEPEKPVQREGESSSDFVDRYNKWLKEYNAWVDKYNLWANNESPEVLAEMEKMGKERLTTGRQDFLLDVRAEEEYKNKVVSKLPKDGRKFNDTFEFENTGNSEKTLYLEFSKNGGYYTHSSANSTPAQADGVIREYKIPAKSAIAVNRETKEVEKFEDRIYDPNNLPDDVLMEMNQYFATLVNSLRSQLGIAPMVVNKNAIEFAKDEAKEIIKDEQGNLSGHNGKVINEVASKRGLRISAPLGERTHNQFYENLYTGTLLSGTYATDKVSKADLYRNMAEGIQGFFFEGYQQYGHAFALLSQNNMGLAYSSTEKPDPNIGRYKRYKLNDDGTLSLEKVYPRGFKWHILSVDPSDKDEENPNSKGVDFEALYGKNSPDNVEKAKYKTAEDVANDIKKAQDEANDKKFLLDVATKDYNTTKEKVGTLGVENPNLANAQKEVETKEQEKNNATVAKDNIEKNITNLTNELATLNEKVTTASNELAAAKEKQQEAVNSLNTAKENQQTAANALTQAQTVAKNAQDALTEAKNKVDSLSNELKELEEKITTLTNQKANLDELNEKLSTAEANLTTAKTTLAAETKKLEELKKLADEAKAKYQDILTRFVADNKERVEYEDVDYKTEYIASEQLDKGVHETVENGKKGKKKVTISYTINPNTGEVTEAGKKEEVVEAVVNKKVKVGVKPTVTTKVLHFETKYEANPEAEANSREEVAGKDGEEKTTVIYELNTATGDVTVKDTKVEKTEPTAKVVKVGTKAKVEVTTEPIAVSYEEDKNAEAGSRVTADEGKAKTTTKTTTYTLNTQNGTVSASDNTVVEAGKPKVVKVGTKAKVEVTTEPIAVTYEEDKNAEAGSKVTTDEGKAKTTTKTTTYTLNVKDGTVSASDNTVVEAGKAKVVKVGTKAKVEVTTEPIVVTYEEDKNAEAGKQTITDEGKAKTTTKTTTYTLNVKDGTVSASDNTVVEDGKAKVVKVGTKQTIDVVTSPIEKTYVEDKNAELNSKYTVKQGIAKVTATITTYTLNVQDGTVTPTMRTEVTEGTPDEIAVGTKSTTATKEVAFETNYVADETLNYGETKEEVAGVLGEATVTTTYKLEGDHAVKDSETTTRTKAPVARVVAVGTKSTTATKAVAFETNYVADPTLNYGETKEVAAGVLGEETVTTTYKLEGDHAVKDAETTSQIKAPVAKVVAVGTKSTTATKEVAFETNYVADPTLNYGETKETKVGVLGEETVTTTYKLDGDHAVKDAETTAQTKAPVAKVVAVGNVKVEKEAIAPKATYEADNTLTYNTTKVEKEGEAGEKTTTTTYKVDKDGNLVNPTATTQTTKEAVNKVVKVGNVETKVEKIAITEKLVEDSSLNKGERKVLSEGKEGERSTVTTYSVNEATGALENPQIATKETVAMEQRVVAVGTKELAAQTPKEEKERLEKLVKELKDQIANNTNLSQDEKDKLLEVVNKTNYSNILTTTINGKTVEAVLDNSKVQAEKLVATELVGKDLDKVKETVANSSLENVEVTTAYDLHLERGAGEVVTANGETRAVTVAVVKAEDENIEVYYVNGDKLELVPSIYEDGKVTFFTSHFSTYTIVKVKKPQQPTPPRPGNPDPQTPGNTGGQQPTGEGQTSGHVVISNVAQNATIKKAQTKLPTTSAQTTTTLVGALGLAVAALSARLRRKED